MTRIIVLTGARGIGKSTVCRETVALAQGKGYVCGGLLTLAHNDVREVLDVNRGDSRRLTREGDAAQAIDQGRAQAKKRGTGHPHPISAQAGLHL